MRFTTAGESHGPALVSILEGLPAGVPIAAADVDRELARRQQGYGRGRRMQIEKDAVHARDTGAAGKVKQYCFDGVVLVVRKRDDTIAVLLTDLPKPLIT